MATVSAGFVLDTTNNSIISTDTSDYAGQGIATSDVVGNVQILLNGVSVYNNPDYTRYSATAQSGSSTTIQLASGASSINQFYKDLYVRIISGTGSGQSRRVISYNGITKTCIVASAWGINPDNTSVYEFAFADIYVVANTSNQRRIALPTQNGVIKQGLYEITYTVFDRNTNDYYVYNTSINIDFTFPVINLTYSVNCVTPLLSSTDATDYTIQGATASVTRSHEVAAPPNVDPTVYSGSDVTIIVPQFYAPTTYQATLTSDVVWDFGGGITISAQLTASQPIQTVCENWICDMFCCLNNLYNQWVSLEGTNSGEAKSYFNRWQLGVLIVDMIKNAYDCGEGVVVNGLVNKFYEKTGCTQNCGCSDNSVPTLVQGLGQVGNIVYSLSSGDSYVTVSTTTGNNSVAWSVSLSPAALALLTANPDIQGLTNIVVTQVGDSYTISGAAVVAGRGISVTSTGSPITAYTVTLKNLLKDQLEVVPTTTTGSFEELMAYSMPSGTLSQDGDSLDIVGWFDCTTNSDVKKCKVAINNTPIFGDIFLSSPQHRFAVFNIKVVRKSATQIGYTFNVSVGNETYPSVYSFVSYDTASAITINNLGTNANKISLDAQSAVAGDVSAVFFQVKLNKV